MIPLEIAALIVLFLSEIFFDYPKTLDEGEDK